jgi:hypothetical protein
VIHRVRLCCHFSQTHSSLTPTLFIVEMDGEKHSDGKTETATKVLAKHH